MELDSGVCDDTSKSDVDEAAPFGGFGQSNWQNVTT